MMTGFLHWLLESQSPYPANLFRITPDFVLTCSVHLHKLDLYQLGSKQLINKQEFNMINWLQKC